MGGKYEIRYYLDPEKIPTCGKEKHCIPPCVHEGITYETIYTNSWFEYMKLRLTKKVIYYKVCSY